MGRMRSSYSYRRPRKAVSLTHRKNTQKKYFKKWRKRTGTKGGQLKLHSKAHRTGTRTWGTAHSYGHRWISKYNKAKFAGIKVYTNGITDQFQLTNTVGVQTSDGSDKCILGNHTDLTSYSKNAVDNTSSVSVYLHHMVLNLKATNQTDANVVIDLYEYKARYNSKQVGLGTVYAASAGPAYPQNTPFQDPTSVQFFKILKVTRYVLAQGESFEHVMHVYPNRWIGNPLLNDSNTLMIKGLTYGILPVQIGMPYNDSTTKTQVSLGKNVVDYVFSKHFYSYAVVDSSTGDNDHNNLVTSFTVGEDIMNEDTGLAVGLVQA